MSDRDPIQRTVQTQTCEIVIANSVNHGKQHGLRSEAVSIVGERGKFST